MGGGCSLVAKSLTSHGGRFDSETENFVTPTIGSTYGKGYGTAEIGGGLVAFDTTQITSKANGSNPRFGDPCHPLSSRAHAPAIAYRTAGDGAVYEEGSLVAPLTTGTDPSANVVLKSGVRRLTPRECERLMGFEDDYTAIEYRGKPAADGPRYEGLGNSMAVPVLRWLGERIQMVEAMC